MQHITANNSGARIGQINFGLLRELFDCGFIGTIEAVARVFLEVGHVADCLGEIILDEAGHVMAVVTVPITDSEEMLPAFLTDIRRNNISILIELLSVWNKPLLAAV